jgi:hypothetical protein
MEEKPAELISFVDQGQVPSRDDAVVPSLLLGISRLWRMSAKDPSRAKSKRVT